MKEIETHAHSHMAIAALRIKLTVDFVAPGAALKVDDSMLSPVRDPFIVCSSGEFRSKKFTSN